MLCFFTESQAGLEPLKQIHLVEILTQKMQFRPLITQEILIDQAIAEISMITIFCFFMLVGSQNTKIPFFNK